MPHITALRQPSDEQTADLMAWRSLALDRMPYFASMLFSLRVLDAPGLGTFACDAQHRLYVDFDGVADWTPELKAEALLHECGHLFGDHMARATDTNVADHERPDWNIAGDCEINDDLRDAGCVELTSFGVLAAKIGSEDYQTAEHYMEHLRKKRQNSPKPKNPGGSGQGKPGESDPGDGNDSGDDDEPYKGCGSGAGGPAAPGELDADDDLGGAADPASKIEHERSRIATASNIREHAAKGRGTVPGGLVAIAEQVLAPPKVPWRQVLAASVRRGIAQRQGDYDSTYLRRHRRTPSLPFGNARVIRPGTFSPVPTLAFVRDTSGSMSDADLVSVTNEIEGIARGVGIRGRDLRVYDVDAAVGSVRDYKGASSIAEITGRGGTDMCVGITAALAQRPMPSAIVVGTDGYTPWPEFKLPVPLIICLIPQSPDADMTHLAESAPDWAITVVAQDT